MSSLDPLKIVHYTEDRIPNPYPKGELPWQVYHKVRNAVVQTCRRHGTTGPLGTCRIGLWRKAPDIMSWERGDADPIYWIIDDQYNSEMYLYMEFPGPNGFTAEWLSDVTQTLARFTGWGIGIRFIQGYVLIFADSVFVNGPGFEGCQDAAGVAKAAQLQIQQGFSEKSNQ